MNQVLAHGATGAAIARGLDGRCPRRYLTAIIGRHDEATNDANSRSHDRFDRAFVRTLCCPGPYRPPAPNVRSWRSGPGRISRIRSVVVRDIVAAGSVEASRSTPGVGPQLHRRLLFVRLRCLLCCRVAESRATRPVFPLDNARCVGPITDVAGPRT
jgi:hypothetical protein